MVLVHETSLWQQVRQESICNVVHIEAEAVSSRVCLTGLRHRHAIICADRVGQAGAERFHEESIVACNDTAPLINIELSEGHLGTHLDQLTVDIFDRDLVCLVATSPDDKVRRLQVLSLIFWCRGLYEFDSLLISFLDRLVHALCVAAQTCEGVQETIFVLK